jgi:hypothetical protein
LVRPRIQIKRQRPLDDDARFDLRAGLIDRLDFLGEPWIERVRPDNIGRKKVVAFLAELCAEGWHVRAFPRRHCERSEAIQEQMQHDCRICSWIASSLRSSQ